MALQTFKLKENNSYTQGAMTKIASNSLDVAQGTLLSVSGGYAVAAGVGTDIIGSSNDQKVFAADNVTVAKAEVSYLPVSEDQLFEAPITGGTITAAKVGNFYDLNASQVVNGATESATTGQVKLEKFISATRGEFSIANK